MTTINVIDNLYEKTDHIRRVDGFNSRDFFTLEQGETGHMRPGLDANQEFYLEARIVVTFWANQAQHDHARKLALQALAHRLYGDILSDLSELKLQISNGNRDGCMVVVDRMESKLYPR